MVKPPPLSLKSRTLTLTYDIPIVKIENFWKGLKEGKLLTTKCKKCGQVFFPPSGDCPDCLSSDMEWVELSGDAELETFTRIVVKPASFVGYEPYIVAIGRLKEGIKVLSWLTGVKREDVKVGMKLKLITKTTPDGRPTYEFIPVKH